MKSEFKQIGLIEVWLGKIPEYFQYHVETIGSLSCVDFYFFTDDKDYDFSYIKHKNFHINYITQEEFLNRFNSISKVKIDKITNPKKIIDFKLSYFEMFSDYLKDYPYVGAYDIDTLFGDLNKTLLECVEQYDFISVGDEIFHNRLSGPLLILRNTTEFHNLIKTDRYYDTLLMDEVYGYGEKELSDVAMSNYKVKIIHSINIESQNGGKNTYEAYWSGGKVFVKGEEKLLYHFYRKKHTKLQKVGNTISAFYDKKIIDDFLWVVHFSEKYETLLPYLMDSIKRYSNRKCVLYSINYTPNFLFKTQYESEQFIFRRIDMTHGKIDGKGRDQKIMSSKPLILMDAIDSFPNKKFVHIDTDIYLTANADDITKFFEKIENYPLMNSHIHDVMYCSNVVPEEKWTSPLHILVNEMNIKEELIFPRRKCNIIVFDENCRWFFKEQMEVYEKYKDTKPGIFLLHDEDSANALLAKYQFKNALPIMDMEESHNLSMEKIHNYSYNMTNTSPRAEKPKTINDFLFFHGSKSEIDYQKIQEEYGSSTLDCEEFVITYSNNTLFFEKNSFMKNKKIDNTIDFIVFDLNGNVILELKNQNFYRYWFFYISDIVLKQKKYLIKIFETNTNKCVFNDIIEN
jgi:hypothetical protein